MRAGFKGLFQEPHLMSGKVGFLDVVGVYSAWKASKLHLTSLVRHLKVTFHLKTQCPHGKPLAWKEERFRSIKKTEGSSRASLQKWFLWLQRSLNQFVPSLPWENGLGAGHSLRVRSPWSICFGGMRSSGSWARIFNTNQKANNDFCCLCGN